MEKKNYERPVMGTETFVPNEFIAGCYRWKLELECTGGAVNGDHYVFNSNNSQNDNPAIGQVIHEGHLAQILYIVTESSETPTMATPEVIEALASVGEFPGVMGNDQNTNGNPSGARHWMKNKLGEYQADYAWYTNGELHFHEGDMVWQLVHGGTGSGPNAS